MKATIHQTIGSAAPVLEILRRRNKGDWYSGNVNVPGVYYKHNASGTKCFYVKEGNHMFCNYNPDRNPSAWWPVDEEGKTIGVKITAELSKKLNSRVN